MATRPSQSEAPDTATTHNIPVDYLPQVELTTEQIQEAKDIARERNESYEDGSMYSDGGTVLGDNESDELHVQGVVAEYAVAEYYGADIDDDVYVTGDDGSDLLVNDLDVDVKSAYTGIPWHKLRLLLQEKDGRDDYADVYMLALVADDYSSVTLVGYIGGNAIQEYEPRDWPPDASRHRDNHVVPQSELSPVPRAD